MIAIVTDSTACITHAEATEMGVVVVPMSYTLSSGASFSEGCMEDDDSAERQVADDIAGVRTSQASYNSFINTFNWLRRADYDVLCLTISSKLSGTYANASQAARRIPGHHIQVVDSLSACGGLYLLIREASRMIAEGGSLSSTARLANRLRERVCTCFSVDDIAPLKRSGRLGPVRAAASGVLGIKPILELCDGTIAQTGISRGKLDQCKRLAEFCEGATGRVAVESFLGDDAAARLSIKLAREDREIERRRVGPVLGAHLGRGCVGVSYIAPEGK